MVLLLEITGGCDPIFVLFHLLPKIYYYGGQNSSTSKLYNRKGLDLLCL